VFRRGFPAALVLMGHRYAADAAAIKQLTPVEELAMEQVSESLFTGDALCGIRVLSLPRVNSRIVEALAQSPVLPTLTQLSMLQVWDARLSQRSVRTLLSNPALTRLRVLSLTGMAVGNAAAAALAESPHLSGWTRSN
jgi:hypothetical protein